MTHDDVALLKLDARVPPTPRVKGVGVCVRCRWSEAWITVEGLCAACEQDHRWAVENKRACDFIHRGIG